MNGAHPDLGPELRRLAQALLNGIDPALRSAATLASAAGSANSTGEQGKCQQVWCPVCALAALVNGEQHPLVTVIADHSVALLDTIRSIVDDMDRPQNLPPDEQAEAVTTNGSEPDKPAVKTRYQPIPVTVEE
ncbi:hypothetical protein A5791_19415 [Mycobacterium sp. 852002-51163_SCH5372311]|uniref:hypothetical protein n=1 Tax=Mycobacterium sp. 852002-51163_SCH5372311 TaxID=1834097 RepID=UPI000800F3A2|nr:hypothetical protein [Mycobacterium sp. 852002-51163_SCH5372311]OBF87437.1 hypothetical protein A5791_19415 [Mycobacterium sp. 852002-51163_SCH5372311]